MLFTFFIVITLLALVASKAPAAKAVAVKTPAAVSTPAKKSSSSSSDEKKVSASLKDTNFNGIEGLNVNIVAPFKVQDYVVGFKYALGNLGKAPESLFAKTTQNIADGEATIDADYNVEDNTVKVNTKWVNKAKGLTLGASGDNKNKVTEVEAKKEFTAQGNKVVVDVTYDVGSKVYTGHTSYDVDGTLLEVDYDTSNKDPVLSVTKSIDSSNEVKPTLSLKSGKIDYSWKRKWTGGSLKSTLTPGEKVNVEWKDEGSNGQWTTNAEFPLENPSKSKVSVTRDWKY